MQDSSLLYQFSKAKPCYYCGKSGPSTREHAPVSFMFEAFDCDSITVPSCETHNTSKSHDDRAIVAFLLKGLYGNLRTGSLTKNMLHALQESHHKLDEAKEVDLQLFVDQEIDERSSLLPHIADTEAVYAWMKQLTAALVWSVVGSYESSIDWDNSKVFSPNFVKGGRTFSVEDAARLLIENLRMKESIDQSAVTWWHGWSAYPTPYPVDIYRFEISFFPDSLFTKPKSQNFVTFRHWFYTEFPWIVNFEAPPQTKQVLQHVVRSIAE